MNKEIYRVIRKISKSEIIEIAIFETRNAAEKFIESQNKLFGYCHTIVPCKFDQLQKFSGFPEETPISDFLGASRIFGIQELSKKTSMYKAVGEAISRNTPDQDTMYRLGELTYMDRTDPDWDIYIHQSTSSYGGVALAVEKEGSLRSIITLGEDDGNFFIARDSSLPKNDWLGAIMKVIGLYNDTSYE